jgi:hypothetical protein
VTVCGPRHDLSALERLARDGRVVTSRRVTKWLVNHDYDAAATVRQLLVSLATCRQWLGSCVLANAEIADEYVVVIEDEAWYLKFYVDGEQQVVNVWSCWWQGVAH